MNQPGSGCVPLFRQGVERFSFDFDIFKDGRNDLSANRVGRVIRIDQVEKGGGDLYGQAGAVAFIKASLFFAQRKL